MWDIQTVSKEEKRKLEKVAVLHQNGPQFIQRLKLNYLYGLYKSLNMDTTNIFKRMKQTEGSIT